MAEDEKRKKLEDFLNLNLFDYAFEKELGLQSSFSEILNDLNNEVKLILDKCIRILMNLVNIPLHRLQNKLISDINRIQEFLNRIDNLRKNGIPNDFATQRNRIIEDINHYINQFYSTSQGDRNLNYYLTFITLNENDNSQRNIEDIKNEAKVILENLKTIKEDSQNILSELQNSASKQSTQNYSKIFEDESSKYSTNIFNWKESGSAEKWLFLGYLFLAFLIADIFLMHCYFPVYQWDSNTSSNILNLSNLIFRITTILVFIILIRFSFKQYSINKHLYTLNKHRANVLNSFNLFLNTIDREDSTTRHALMMEVSKAIYESGKTGYIDSKSDEVSNPSIIEITKLLNNKS